LPPTVTAAGQQATIATVAGATAEGLERTGTASADGASAVLQVPGGATRGSLSPSAP
jgi:hypothetical protein